MVEKMESILDCSRMMLPEHKIRIISDKREQQWRDREKLVLDPQKWELISSACLLETISGADYNHSV
jgi:hypothetical protein